MSELGGKDTKKSERETSAIANLSVSTPQENITGKKEKSYGPETNYILYFCRRKSWTDL